jgi:hypothetical protein
MSLYCSTGSIKTELTSLDLKELLTESLSKLGEPRRVLAVPPDQTRAHSRAGELTLYAWQHYGDRMHVRRHAARAFSRA